ncbi:MAG TPA: permease-like cell division protein FtsX [Candidatus Dormibacteraeota bacterium]|nr:permease-like cell division protein FtsX [Candidatus Dormibacteraeota bacterium]
MSTGGATRYVLRELWRGLVRHRALCITSVISMASILLIFLLFLMVLQSVDQYTSHLESREEVSVFLNEGLSRADLATVAAALRSIEGVDSVRYVSKDEAWESFRQDITDEALVQAVGSNPLPASYVLRPAEGYRTAEGVRSIARGAETVPHVEDVRYAGEWVLRAEQVVGTLRRIGAALGMIVLLGVLFVVGATTRLSVQTRLDSIHLVRSLGGGFLFNEAPYLVEGFALAAVSSALTIAMARALNDQLAEGVFRLQFLPPIALLCFVGVSGLLGLIGSWIAVATLPRKWLL